MCVSVCVYEEFRFRNSNEETKRVKGTGPGPIVAENVNENAGRGVRSIDRSREIRVARLKLDATSLRAPRRLLGRRSREP